MVPPPPRGVTCRLWTKAMPECIHCSAGRTTQAIPVRYPHTVSNVDLCSNPSRTQNPYARDCAALSEGCPDGSEAERLAEYEQEVQQYGEIAKQHKADNETVRHVPPRTTRPRQLSAELLLADAGFAWFDGCSLNSPHGLQPLCHLTAAKHTG